MIKSYISIFLTLLMPMLLLFIVISTLYYASTHFEFSQAIKLGTVRGSFMGVGFSLFAAFSILLIRVIRLYSMKITQTDSSSKVHHPVKLDSTLYEKKTLTVQKESTHENHETSACVEEKAMILMNQNLTYESTLSAIKEKKLGKLIQYTKEHGKISLQNEDEEIHIHISALTKHTSEVSISSTHNALNIRKILSYLKETEHSFMQY